MTFQVGDRVEYINTGGTGMPDLVGTVGTVTGAYDDLVYFEFDEYNELYDTKEWGAFPHNLKRIDSNISVDVSEFL